MLRNPDGLLSLSHVGCCLTGWWPTYGLGFCHLKQGCSLDLCLAWGAVNPPRSSTCPSNGPGLDTHSLSACPCFPRGRCDPTHTPSSRGTLCVSPGEHPCHIGEEQSLPMSTLSHWLDALHRWECILHLCVLCILLGIDLEVVGGWMD